MANNNVQNVRFLRNGNLFISREQATSALTNFTLTAEMDGSSILARYKEGSDPIKTLVGYVYYKDDSNKSITIFDIDDAGADVDEKIKELRNEINAKLGTTFISSGNTVESNLTALSGTSEDASGVTSVWGAKAYADDLISTLDYTDVAVAGQYVSQVSEANGQIAVVRVDLPSLTEVKETGKPIVAVSEDKGQVAASVGTINAEYVNIADSGSLITATTVEGALAEIAAEIDAMDLAVVSGDGEVITAVSEQDGKVSASKTAIKDVKLTGYVKNSSTGAISSTDDIEDALSKLENTIGSNEITNADGSITVTPANGSTTDVKVHIKEGEKVIKLDANQGGIYTNLNLVEITGETLPAEIKVRYELRDSDSIKIGESIDIPKDSHIVSINYITTGEHAQNLEYVYVDVSGHTNTTYVDMSALVLEAEFESGVTVDAGSHIVHGVVDPTSEKDSSSNSFLTVGANGFKIGGINGEITTKINALNATVSGESADSKVNVKVTETNGVITAVEVVGTDIASAQGLADEITARGNADTALSNRLGDNVTASNTASAQFAALSGTSSDASGVTSVYGAKAYAKDYTDEKVAAVVDGLDATVSGETADGKVNVKVTEANGVITAVNVVGTDIASASALTAEIAARKDVDGQSGDTYAANTSANYISGATSLNDADVKLNAALKALSDATVNEVQVNGVALAESSNAVNVQISSTPASDTAASPIIVNTNGTSGAVTLQIQYLDCGVYDAQ